MKSRYLFLIALTTVFLSSCSYNRSPEGRSYDQNEPGYNYEFEGDMYFSTPYDPLSQWNNHYVKVNKDSINQRMPAVGSIARGKSEYIFRYSNDVKVIESERTRASKEISFPMDRTPEILEKGKIAYLKYCQQCHGAEGEGDGPVVKSGLFPGPSWKTYKSDYIKQLPVGQMFFSITYGKGLMGAHGPIVTPEERWQIIHYIKEMAGSPGTGMGVGAVASAPKDSTATPKTVAN